MTLPKVEVPTYELEVPSTDEKLKFRPFLVKEEKILLMALESKDQGEMINALKGLIKACTFEKFDPDNSPLFDLEYIFRINVIKYMKIQIKIVKPSILK